MKRLLAFVLVFSLVFSISCVALVPYPDCEDTDVQSVDDPSYEILLKKRDALIDEYMSLPENEKEAFLMEEALPSLMEEIKNVPELEETLTISQEEMDQVTAFLNAVNDDADCVPE